MNIEQVKEHALILASGYFILGLNIASCGSSYDIDAHNLCSAVIERWGQPTETIFSYSNPSGLPKGADAAFLNLVSGKVRNPIVDRGGMQDLHTEVRIINYLNDAGYFDAGQVPAVVTFFSSRSVCPTCRSAIASVINPEKGNKGRNVAFNAMDFKAEYYRGIYKYIYPILSDPSAKQIEIDYES